MPKRKKTDKCPHCLREYALVELEDTIKDTNNVTVRVWTCADCDYSEGRPVEVDNA